MSKKEQSSELPRHAKSEPGAEITMRADEDGDVTVSFSDGSDDLNVSRREFMRISGVAAATAAMSGAACRNDVERIVPYVDRPEEVRIGLPQQYATTCPGCDTQCGVLVTTRAGRPVKLEGNPDHPVSKGGLCARGQSSYMRLYDPSRQQNPVKPREDDQHENVTYEQVDTAVIDKLESISAAGAGSVGILTTTMTGSAHEALIGQILDAVPGSKHYSYEPVSSEAVAQASEHSYGQRHIPHYRFDKADLIVSLGSDFLGTWLSPVEFTKQFSSRRRPEDDMSKLVAFEGNLSVTGSNADERHRVRYSHLPYIALSLAYVVENKMTRGELGARPAIRGSLENFSPEDVSEITGVPAEEITKLGAALANKKGKSLVVAGGAASATESGVGLEAAVNLLNALLGNDGKTIERGRPSKQASGEFSQLAELVDDIENGEIDVLIIDRANPVYSAPPALGFAEALEKVPFVVSTSDRVDETAVHADYLATGNNALESWGDSNPFEGVYSIQQPVILPMYDTRSFEESLRVWFGNSNIVPEFKPFLEDPDEPSGNIPGEHFVWDPGAWYRYLRNHWREELFAKADTVADFDSFWKDVLRNGTWVVPGSQNPEPRINVPETLAVLPKSLPEAAESKPGDLSAKELHTYPTVALYDGRQANNGHLQELPDPITKHVWGSYVQVSPKTFNEADLELGDYLAIEVEVAEGDTRTLEFPVIMQPGMHDDVVAVPLGYGRTRCGVVGDDVGVNAFEFSRVADSRQILSGHTAKLSKTGKNEPLAVVQGSQVIDLHQRDAMASTTLEEFEKDPEAGIHKHPAHQALWEQHDYDVKWGMSIDLSKCTGCSACVTACQEENNIPVVGRQGIMEGREMHWMRIDRYYKLPGHLEERKSLVNDPMYDEHPYVAFSEHMENPRVLMQPMMCQHCENAPCETVCPVLATTHSSDGLNQMTYNRCVGTRYCANNCPFKVRRFNWYNYAEDRSDDFMSRIFPELDRHAELNVEEPLPLGMNPEVTVRSRGVMEKCTFCVQRIRRAKWQMREEGRSQFRDGDVVTACQQTCPADAIKFGNLLDERAEVAKEHRSKRALSPLSGLNVESSVGYLTSVWNTKAKEKHASKGHADDKHESGGGH
jgi:molybdopterin-containing oxidoreductase family iron-sulfur binding subunit